ncbi:MAG: hypothetical protein M3O67_10090, partial [Bacteroidota bacterium]|nr:hypothetical protein [Bacteroidota bacterium]
MPLITTIEEVRANGVKVSYFSADTGIADMQAAEERFIAPLLGETLYELIIADAPDALYDPLIVKVKRAIAPLAYWLELPNIQSQITDGGLGTFTSDKHQPLHRWEYEALLEN